MRPQMRPKETIRMKDATAGHQIRSMKPLFPGSQSGSSIRSLPV